MCPASAGRAKKSLLSSFLLLLMGVAASTMVADSVSLMDQIFLADRKIWVLASYRALPYINSSQSECMSGYLLLTLYLSGIFCIYHQFVDLSCTFDKSVYFPAVDEYCHLLKTQCLGCSSIFCRLTEIPWQARDLVDVTRELSSPRLFLDFSS